MIWVLLVICCLLFLKTDYDNYNMVKILKILDQRTMLLKKMIDKKEVNNETIK